jgi:predicted Zn-dependent protease
LIALIRVDVLRKDLAATTSRLEQLGSLGGDPSIVTMLEGDIGVATGDLDGAAQHYRGLAKQGNREAALKLADVLSRAGNDVEAKRVLQDHLSAHPNDFGAELAMAGLVLKAGNTEASIARYSALNAKHADSPVVLNNLAWLFYEAKDPRATEMARRAFELAPQNPQVADTLGWILLQQDSGATEAVKLLESAAGAKPGDATIHYHLAVAYEKLNRRTEARRAVDRSLELGEFPELTDAKSLKARL